MVTIFIDNKPYEVKEGLSLLEACLSLGFNIPYFCWHPAMKSVGACRQCAVKLFRDDKDTRGRIVMSCMTPAANNTRLSIDDPEARQFRASVIEWLMLNHPHDCPVCDEGGECHLQDMTVMTGHVVRRTRFKKRTHRNQYLGPFLNHEMNRCIQCYRCVRFYSDYAMGRDFAVFGTHDSVYFGRHEAGILESPFSGNLVEVCPTGVFTDKTLKRHYTRKWDLQTAPSVCVHCGVGCNTIAGERYGMLRRILNRYNSAVNGYFLCDRGRFGYEFVNSEERILTPAIRPTPEADLRPSSTGEAVAAVAALLKTGARVIGIGSPRASLEANFLLRTLVGPAQFYAGFSEAEHDVLALQALILKQGPALIPSLSGVASADAVFLLGEDVTNTAPMVDLTVRQAVRQKPLEIAKALKIPLWDDAAVRNATQEARGPLFVATAQSTMVDAIATRVYHAPPDEVARLGLAVAHAIDPDAPSVTRLDDASQFFAAEVAAALTNANQPLVISGPGATSVAVTGAAANVARALHVRGIPARLFLTTLECNSLGLALMEEKGLGAAFDAASEGGVETIIVLENDLYRRADAALVDRFFQSCRHLIVLDQLVTLTTAKADFVLPAATFAEADGTLVNNEGRAQRSYAAFPPRGLALESWRWLAHIMAATNRTEAASWSSLDNVILAFASALPVFAPVPTCAPAASFRITGRKVPRQPHRYSGRTAMTAHVSVHESRPPADPDTPLAFSMEGHEGIPPSALIPRFWAPGWNSVQSVNKFQSEIGGPLLGGDPGKRLLEPDLTDGAGYFRNVPEAFQRRPGEWLVLPRHHIYGSEELSSRSPAIAERIPSPYLALSPDDAAILQLAAGVEAELIVSGTRYTLPVKFAPELPAGVALLPVGLPGLTAPSLPAWATIRRLGS